MGPSPITRCLALGCLALAVMGQAGGLFQQPASSTITYRSAEDDSLDMMVDYQAIIEGRVPEDTEEDGDEEDGEDSSPAAAGSFRAAQDTSKRVNLSKPLREGWQMDPVMLHRRQAGEPSRKDDDVTPQLFGVELRKEF